jgi:hypothetical protein
MELQQQKILKWLIDHPEWITKTQAELFTNDRSYIFHMCQLLINKGRTPTWQSLQHIIEHKVKPDIRPKLLDSLNFCQAEQDIDKTTALEIRDDLRSVAFEREIKKLNNLDVNDPKSRQVVLDRLHALQLDEEPEVMSRVVSFNEFDQHIQEEQQILESGLPFLLDTGSDFKRGELINLLAASGNFKTGAMSHVTKHMVSNEHNVLMFSMEDTNQTLLSRLGHGLLGMTPYQYSQLTPSELEMRFSTINLGKLDCVTGREIILEDLKDFIDDLEVEKGYKYDMIAIDYSAQVRLKNEKKNEREDQVISKIFRELKLLAVNKQVVVMSAIQSNREGYGEKKKPRVENSAGSMGGVHASDMMISLKYTPNQQAPQSLSPQDEEPHDVKGFVQMTVRKKRLGTVNVDDNFIFEHKRNGNIAYVNKEDVDDNRELWDNLFEL